MGGKEQHISCQNGDRNHISGWSGVIWKRQRVDMGRGVYRLSCSCRFRSVGLFWMAEKPVFKEL